MASMIFLDQLGGEYVSLMFPRVVSRGISFPLNEVLKVSIPPEVTMIHDGLDFILFFPINDVWGRARIIVPILTSFPERR